MMNPTHHFRRMRELLGEFEPSREKSLAATKLDEAEMWLGRCAPTAEAYGRDQCAPMPTDGRIAMTLADDVRAVPMPHRERHALEAVVRCVDAGIGEDDAGEWLRQIRVEALNGLGEEL
jgi:hypothetical protein